MKEEKVLSSKGSNNMDKEKDASEREALAALKKVKASELRVESPFSQLFSIHPEILEAIKEDITKHGYDESQAIVVWKSRGIVVDGHTKLRAALETETEYVVVYEKEFAGEDEAIEYAIHNHTERRNLTDADILRLVEKLDKRYKVGRPKITSGEVIFWKDNETLRKEKLKEHKTSKRTANLIGISATKVEKARTILDRSTFYPGNLKMKEAVFDGKMSITKAYDCIRKEEKSNSKEPKYFTMEIEFQNNKRLVLAQMKPQERVLGIPPYDITLKIQVPQFKKSASWEGFERNLDWLILGIGQPPDVGCLPEGSQLYFPVLKNQPKDPVEKSPEEQKKDMEKLIEDLPAKERNSESEKGKAEQEFQKEEDGLSLPSSKPSEELDSIEVEISKDSGCPEENHLILEAQREDAYSGYQK